jgi:hypothetical protein
MQCAKLFFENQEHFLKRTGFYPIQPFKKNRLGIYRLLSPSHAGIISSMWLLNKSIIQKNTNIKYIASFWELLEKNLYKNSSSRINIVFKNGAVKNAVKQALESDMAFLIQKNDGKFTIRKWGKFYNIHEIPSWIITKFPSKDFSEAQKSFFSSCLINYNFDDSNDTYNNSYLYNNNKKIVERTYHKILRRDFNTCLTNESDVINLASQLSSRFNMLKETIKVSF